MNVHRSGESSVTPTVDDNLHIQLLGEAAIQVAGRSLILNDQKALALLFYLAATGQPHTRDHLATLLWSESSGQNARHSLRSSLHHLRQFLSLHGASDTLVAERILVQLRLPVEACDVTHFRHLVANNNEQAFIQANSLYRGPLLAGFTLADAPVFDDWLRNDAADLSRSYRALLDHLATAAESRSSWDRAIEYTQRLVQADSLDEMAQRHLIRLYLQIGAPGRALRQYQQFTIQLKHEFDIAPAPETQELLHHALQPLQQETLSTNEFIVTQPVAKSVVGTLQSALPLVGREDLLNQLRALSQQAFDDHGITVMLQGEAGIGKSRLLDDLSTQLALQPTPWIILRGSCSPYDDLLPYGPFFEALQTAASGDLTDLLAIEPRSTPAEAGKIGWRILQALRLLSHSNPVLLAVDDLHWANSATLHLFGFLSTRIVDIPVLLIGTIQQTSAIPAIQRMLALGRSRRQVQLIPVTAFDLATVTRLLLTLGVDPHTTATLADWLHELSGGNPFILGELLAQLRAEAILIREGSNWRLDIPRWLRQRAIFTLPDTTYDLAAWRLASLTPEKIAVLEVLAVAGQPLPITLIRDLPDVQFGQLLESVDDLLTRGLLIEVSGDTLALPHHLLREALLTPMSNLRRRTIHRQLLQVIEHCPALEARFRLHQLAQHAVAGEDKERALRYGLPVLDELLRDEPSAETLTFFLQLQSLLVSTATASELLRLARALAKVYQSLGQLEAAAHWNQRQLELAQVAGDLAAEATTHFDQGELALVSNDYPLAVKAARAGLDMCEHTAQPDLEILAGWGFRLLGAAQAMEGSDLSSAEAHLQRAVLSHRRTERVSDLCADLFELGNVAAQRGELLRALSFYQEAGQAAETGHVPYFLALAHNNFAYHSLLLGNVQAAQEAAVQGQHVAESHALVGALLFLMSTRGEIQAYLADWQAADKSFRQGLTLSEDLGNRERQAGYRAGLALVAQSQQDLAQATALLEEGLAIIAEQGYWHLRTRMLFAQAEIQLLRGGLDQARLCLDEGLMTAQSQGRALLVMQGQRLQARLLAANAYWTEARQLFATLLKQTDALDLPLETARTQAAFGTAALRYSTDRHEGRSLLAAARETFRAYSAQADLHMLQMALHQ